MNGLKTTLLKGLGAVAAVVARLSPLAATSLVLALGFAGLVAWLALTADDEVPPSAPGVASTPPPVNETRAPAKAAPPPQTPAKEVQVAVPPAPVTAKPAAGLPPVPDPDLVEDGKYGPLPKIAADGRKPWQVYARPYAGTADRPRIAIAVGWLGLKRKTTEMAIKTLPPEVTLGLSPYAPKAQNWVKTARAAGHEVMLMIPMEPINYPVYDPGPHTLLTGMSAEDNLDRLQWLMSRIVGYIGVINDMGSKFTSVREALTPAMAVFRDRGLLFLDARSAATSIAAPLAREMGVPRVINNRYLDAEINREAIDRRLEQLEKLARLHRVAVGLAHPYPVTLERLAGWTATLADKGIDLVPVSAVADSQPER